jgi:hypothetical protein
MIRFLLLLIFIYEEYLLDKDWDVYNGFGKIFPFAVIRAIIKFPFILFIFAVLGKESCLQLSEEFTNSLYQVL